MIIYNCSRENKRNKKISQDSLNGRAHKRTKVLRTSTDSNSNKMMLWVRVPLLTFGESLRHMQQLKKWIKQKF